MVGSRSIPAAGGGNWQPTEPDLRITGSSKSEVGGKNVTDLKLSGCLMLNFDLGFSVSFFSFLFLQMTDVCI